MAAAAHPPIETDPSAEAGLSLLRDRLPPLEGRLRALTTAGYVAVLVATLLLFATSTWFKGVDLFINVPATARYDFRTSSTIEGARVAGVGEAARSAGLKIDDRIVAIDNDPLPREASEFEIGRRLSAKGTGEPLSLSVRRDGAHRTDLRLSPREFGWDRTDPHSGLPLWLYVAIMLLVQPELILFVASVLLFRARRSDPEAMLFAFAFLFLYWTNFNLWWLSNFNIDFDALSLVGMLGWVLSFIAIGAFPDGRFVPSWARWLIVGGFIAQLGFILQKSLWSDPPLWTDVAAGGAMLLLVVVSVTAVVIRYRSTPPGIQKQQIKWAAAGFAISASVWLIMMPLLLTNSIIYEGNASVFVAVDVIAYVLAFASPPIGLLIALLRYRLYDFEAVISRSAAYAFITLILAATFAIVAQAIEAFAEQYFGREAGVWPGVLAAGVAVLLITPLNNRIQNWAERRFHKALSDLRRVLPECVDDLRETSSLPAILDVVLDQIMTGVRASRAAVLIGNDVFAARGAKAAEVSSWVGRTRLDPTRSLDCDWNDMLFPLRIPLRVRHDAQGAYGWIFLGTRPDGSFYGKDEREALAEIAEPIARAVQVVLVRQAQSEELHKRISSLEKKLSAIGQAVERLSTRQA